MRSSTTITTFKEGEREKEKVAAAASDAIDDISWKRIRLKI